MSLPIAHSRSLSSSRTIEPYVGDKGAEYARIVSALPALFVADIPFVRKSEPTNNGIIIEISTKQRAAVSDQAMGVTARLTSRKLPQPRTNV